MSINYEDILNKTWDELPETVALPVGSWLLRGKGAKYLEPKGDNSGQMLFIYGAKEAMNDVDQEDLDKLGPNYDVTSNKVFVKFWIEDSSDWEQVRRHLKKHGIETAGKSLPDTFKEFRGKEIVAYLDQRTYTNSAGDEVTENVASNFTQPE